MMSAVNRSRQNLSVVRHRVRACRRLYTESQQQHRAPDLSWMNTKLTYFSVPAVNQNSTSRHTHTHTQRVSTSTHTHTLRGLSPSCRWASALFERFDRRRDKSSHVEIARRNGGPQSLFAYIEPTPLCVRTRKRATLRKPNTAKCHQLQPAD